MSKTFKVEGETLEVKVMQCSIFVSNCAGWHWRYIACCHYHSIADLAVRADLAVKNSYMERAPYQGERSLGIHVRGLDPQDV